MKKLIALALAVLMVAALAVSVSAGLSERQTVTVYKLPDGYTPTLDGVINNGEWDKANAIDINADNAYAWAGDVTCPVYFYYSWNDDGLWVAAEVADLDVCVADHTDLTNVYSMDAFQIALDPAGLIGDGQGGGGMFYSIGPLDDGTLGACYHPYGGAAEELAAGYTGAYAKTDTGWSFEMMIPWASIEILADDGFAWTHEAGSFINAKICYLDRNDGGNETNAYTVCIDGTEPGMDTTAYSYRLDLDTKAAAAVEEAVAEEAAAEEAAAEEATDAAAEEVAEETAPVAAATADAGIVVAVAVMAVAAGVVLSKKH